MIVLVLKYLTPKGFRGITLFPFVFLTEAKDKEDAVMLNHERIHFSQQKEMLVIPFFIWYGIEFLWRWMQYKKKHLAYRNISFEREAYGNEKDLGYLQRRSLWRFFKYL